MKTLIHISVLVFSLMLNSSAFAQFYLSPTADRRTGVGYGFSATSTNCDVYDDGVYRLTATVVDNMGGGHSYVLVNEPTWGSGAVYLPVGVKFPDVAITHAWAPTIFFLNITYYDPTAGMMLQQYVFNIGNGFASDFFTVLDNNLGTTSPTSGPHIDVDQENLNAVIVWRNQHSNNLRCAHLYNTNGLTYLSAVRAVPLSVNMIEPDVAISMSDAYFTFLDFTRKNVFVEKVSLNDIDNGVNAYGFYTYLSAGSNYLHFNPRIATSCQNINYPVEWTIVMGAGYSASTSIVGWSGSNNILYNSAARFYTDSHNWANKLNNKYKMDNSFSHNACPAVTYQHSDGAPANNFVQIAWQTDDALNNFMGRQAGANTIVSITCDNTGEPVTVTGTGSTEPEYQITPFRWNTCSPPTADSSGVSNLNSQSCVSLSGRNSYSLDQVMAYYDAANSNYQYYTWDEVLIKDGITAANGFRHGVVNAAATALNHPVTIASDDYAVALTAATAAQVSVYPNPFAAQVEVHTNNPGAELTLLVYDNSGRMVTKAKGVEAAINADLKATCSNWANGSYIMQVLTNDQIIATTKLIKVNQN